MCLFLLFCSGQNYDMKIFNKFFENFFFFFFSFVWRTSHCVVEIKDNNKIVSLRHNNISLFILTYWWQVSVIRPSSGHPYEKF